MTQKEKMEYSEGAERKVRALGIEAEELKIFI